MAKEQCPSERLKVEAQAHTDVVFDATCVSCGSTSNIHLWPHRNGHNHMVGFVFACAGCQDIMPPVTMDIHGIRGDTP